MKVLSIVYIIKMFPRLSETFILNEVLALEVRGVKIRVLSLKQSDSTVEHPELKSVRARVDYLPESVWRGFPQMLAAQAHFMRRYPRRWAQAFVLVLRRGSLKTAKRWLQAGAAAQLIEGSDVGHIHAHFAHGPTTVAMIMGIFLNLPFSFTAHAKDIFHKDNHNDTLKLKMNHASFVVTVTDFNRRHLIGLNPAAAAKVHVVRNGLPLANFPLRPEKYSNGQCILSVGRLVEKKGFPTLVEACAILAAKGKQFECNIVGSGVEHGRIEETVKRYRLETCVHLLGAVDDEALRDLYIHATVFALPCRVASTGDRDGLPTVLIEAMALGVPVVTTPVTGIPELVADGQTGLLVPPDDSKALAGALERTLDDAELCRRLAMAAREKVKTDYRVEVNVAALEALFAGEAP